MILENVVVGVVMIVYIVIVIRSEYKFHRY